MLAVLSCCCIVLAIMVQFILVDRSMKRRALSLFQLKLLADAVSSWKAHSVTQGYATAKFTEATYEALSEVCGQLCFHSHILHKVPDGMLKYISCAGCVAVIQGPQRLQAEKHCA